MRRYRNEIGVCLALTVLTLGALGHACWNGFVNYDDGDYVVRNAHVKAGLTPTGLVWAFTTTHAANWHPLTWLSLELDATAYGPEAAWGFHLTNLLLHTATVLLLFLVLRRMTGAVWRSAVVAALFAVHPAHVESVAWVAERKDVLSGLFWMLTLLAYARYAERPGWGRYLLVLAAFALGLLAKPMLVTLPCVLLLLDYWPLLARRACGIGTLLLEKLPLFALTAAACVVTVYAQKQGGAVSTLEQVSLGDRLMNCLAAYAGYLAELVWPVGLAAFYPHPHGRTLLSQAIAAGFVLATITALVVWARRKRYLAVGWLWYLGTLVPVIGLVQVGSQGMADRYTYIPYVGLFIALTWGVADLLARWPLRVPSAVVLAALLLGVWAPLGLWYRAGVGAAMMEDHVLFLPAAALTGLAVVGWAAGRLAGLWPRRLSGLAPIVAVLLGACVAFSAWQVRLWQNSIWLWEYATAVTKDSVIGHNNLGDAYLNSKHPERLTRARENFLIALRLRPEHVTAHYGLGLVLMEQGQLAEAAAQLQQARALDPALPKAALDYGVALARLGRFEEALAQFEDAGRLEPGWAAVPDQTGRALAALDRWEPAVDAFRRAVELDPRQNDYRADLAWALWHLGQTEASTREYAAVVEADGDWPETARDRAEKLATGPAAAQRNGFDATRLAEQACQALRCRDGQR